MAWEQDIADLDKSDTDLATSSTGVWASREKGQTDEFVDIFKGLSTPLQNAISNAADALSTANNAADKAFSNITQQSAVANLLGVAPSAISGLVGNILSIGDAQGTLTANALSGQVSASLTYGEWIYVDVAGSSTTLGSSAFDEIVYDGKFSGVTKVNNDFFNNGNLSNFSPAQLSPLAKNGIALVVHLLSATISTSGIFCGVSGERVGAITYVEQASPQSRPTVNGTRWRLRSIYRTIS